MQLLSVKATIFSKKKFVFSQKKLKKPFAKVAQKTSNPLFSLLPEAAQTAQTEEFMFQNVAYRPNVCRTGVTRYLSMMLQSKIFHIPTMPAFQRHSPIQ
jgi:hypothetical protein